MTSAVRVRAPRFDMETLLREEKRLAAGFFEESGGVGWIGRRDERKLGASLEIL